MWQLYALTAAFAIGAKAETSVLLGRGDSLSPWTVVGPATLGLSTTATPWSDLPFLNLSYNFAPGGWNCAVEWGASAAALNVPGRTNLTLAVYNPSSASAQISVNVLTEGYHQFGSWPQIPGPGWSNLSFSLTESSQWLPAGFNSSLILTGVNFGVQGTGGPDPGKVGWLGFADVALITEAAPSSIPDAILLSPINAATDLDGVVVAGAAGNPSSVSLGVQITNRLQQDCTLDLALQLHASTGPMGEGVGGFDDGWVTCATGTGLSAWQNGNVTCSVPTATPGFYALRTLLNGSDCGTPQITLLESGVAVVMPQPPVAPVTTRNVHPMVFGSQMTSEKPLAAAAIGAWTVRAGPLWRWVQYADKWNLSSSFDWADSDGIFGLSAAGLETLLDAREIAPAWAAAKNNSGPSWAEFPGPEHYDDYQHYLTIMMDRYGSMVSSVEVSNEVDGLSYFQPYPIPLDYAVNLSVALHNITHAAMRASVNISSDVKLIAMPSSSFDIKQTGNGGSTYGHFERQHLNAPGVIQTADAVSLHPYQTEVWVPWVINWANSSFTFPNETAYGFNSTTAQLLYTASLMSEAAAAAGIANYEPVLWPSEWGYNLIQTTSLANDAGWVHMHAALVAQGLVHFRSYPLAQYVKKALYFAAYDGCCAESNGYFGLWRPQQWRSGVNATQHFQQPANDGAISPLPSVSAYATGSVLLDVHSGRLAGTFVVDNSAYGATIPPGQTQLPPSCVAFAPDPSASPVPAPLIALFNIGHHYNDRTLAQLLVKTAQPASALTLLNGLGTAMPIAINATASGNGVVALDVAIAPLPQYLLLPADADAEATCATLTW